MAKIFCVNVERIREKAKENGITLKHLCDLCGRSRTYICDAARGNARIGDYEIAVIANALHTSVEYLTDKTDDCSKSGMVGGSEENFAKNLRDFDEELYNLMSGLTAKQKKTLKAFLLSMKDSDAVNADPN